MRPVHAGVVCVGANFDRGLVQASASTAGVTLDPFVTFASTRAGRPWEGGWFPQPAHTWRRQSGGVRVVRPAVRPWEVIAVSWSARVVAEPATRPRRATCPRRAAARSRHVEPVLPLWFTLLLAAVVTAVTVYGLGYADAYRVSPGVRQTLPDTLRGQDLLTLLTVPALIWTAMRARRGSLRAHLVWLALLLYYAYSYLMYVVAPFNDVFLLYVAVIGLSTYGMFNGLVRIDIHAAAPAFTPVRTRALAYFLLVVGTLFVGLWLSQVIPAIPGGVPDGLFVYDIPSTVHVLDLAYVLPLILATGVLLLRGHRAAPVLAVLVLVKMLTLGLALLLMAGFVVGGGGELSDPSEPYIWGAITVLGAGWLYALMRRVAPAPPGWLRPELWPQP
jgi:hypothetical protein